MEVSTALFAPKSRKTMLPPRCGSKIVLLGFTGQPQHPQSTYAVIDSVSATGFFDFSRR